MKLEGTWTIERAYELKQLLMERLSDEGDVVVDLRGVVAVDLSFLQLLCSAHRTFLGLNRRFSLDAKRPEALKEFVKNAGYAHTLGCHQAKGGNCLWIGGWE
jgi:anti-anti-sigma regulatory factor